MPDFVLIVLATFWVWETVRFAMERYAPSIFDATRVVHPVLVAILPVLLQLPDLVAGLAAAGATGLLVALTDRFLVPTQVVPQYIPRSQSKPGLPSLPR